MVKKFVKAFLDFLDDLGSFICGLFDSAINLLKDDESSERIRKIEESVQRNHEEIQRIWKIYVDGDGY